MVFSIEEKTDFQKAVDELHEAWRTFIITFGKELKLDKLVDWLSKKLNRGE